MEPKKDQTIMEITCKTCGKPFDSTFTVDEFVNLSREQYEAGTLHLCPFCGTISLYRLKDYHEQKPQ